MQKQNTKQTKCPRKSETDTSESVSASDADVCRERDEGDVRSWIVYYLDMWKCYWKKKFFRQMIRSTIVFILGMKLLREIKGLDLLPALPCAPEVPDEPIC